MKTIVFYISGHGFGHTTRSLSLIRELGKRENIRIFIRTDGPVEFIKQSLTEYDNIDISYRENDVGLILNKDSLDVDYERLQEEVKNWVSGWEQIITEESSFLQDKKADLVISDITPWVFPMAKKVGIKNMAISNFTWYDQYRELLERDKYVEEVGNAYQDVDLFLRLPLNLKIAKTKNIEDIGFISRKIDNNKVEEIRKKYRQDKKLIFVGIGKSVDYDILKNLDFERYDKYNWLFSAGTPLKGKNIYQVPAEETEMQNYIAACDYVITKAGWSSVAETVLAGVPMLLIERDQIPEDRRIIEKVKKKGLGLSISPDDFFALRFEEKFRELDKLKNNTEKYPNQVDEVTERILSFIK